MANVYSPFPDEQPSFNNRSSTAATADHFIGCPPPVIHTTVSMTGNHYPHQTTFQDEPCEKYRQFMDSSVQERTFMIEKLVETFANVIDSIWHPKFLIEQQQKQQQQQLKVMPTRGFCNEILKRSKATYSTLQISLFYIFRVKRVVYEKLYHRIKKQQQQTNNNNKMEDLQCCGRRMFLASLMVASKYLHDKNYQNKAWSKITGLDIKEINAAEMAFLNLIDYKLFVSKPTFDKWYTQLHGHIQKSFVTVEKKSTNSIGTSSLCSSLSITQAQQQLTITTTSPSSPLQQQYHQQNNNKNYPSPPLDMNHTSSTGCSPSNESIISTSSSQDSISTDIFHRNGGGDVGVDSFDIYSPTSSSLSFVVGQKRSLLHLQHQQQEEYLSQDNNNKRICQ